MREKMSYIVTIIAVVVAAIFALMVKLWTGFAYFVLVIFLLLSVFWGAWLIWKYFTDFRQELAERFTLFRAQTINRQRISSQHFDANLQQYKKEFSKKMLKDKVLKWCVISFCFACGLAFLLGMIWYK